MLDVVTISFVQCLIITLKGIFVVENFRIFSNSFSNLKFLKHCHLCFLPDIVKSNNIITGNDTNNDGSVI